MGGWVGGRVNERAGHFICVCRCDAILMSLFWSLKSMCSGQQGTC